MIECETTLRTWGNSFGIVIPKEEAIKEGFKVNQKVKILVTQTNTITVGELFGKRKKSKGNLAKKLREIDKELEGGFLRR